VSVAGAWLLPSQERLERDISGERFALGVKHPELVVCRPFAFGLVIPIADIGKSRI